MTLIDLHTHSSASDGTAAPADVVNRARSAGLDVVALTDHDTVAGLPAATAGLPAGLSLIPGIELSCATVDAGGRRTELHLLGYLFDPDEPALTAARDALRHDRERRALAMVDKLRELGAPVTAADVRRIAGDGAIGRPHLARALVEAGVVPNVQAAFAPEWIGSGGRAYVHKYSLDPLEAVRLVAGAGGVSVFAHPGAQVRGPVVGDDVVAAMAREGLAGLEVDHPDQPEDTRRRLRGLAADLGLLITGSSDDHGEITGFRYGCERTDPEVLAALVERATGAAPVAA